VGVRRGSPLAGLVGDRWSRKYLILGGLTFWSIITLLTAWSRKYEHLVLFRALEGLGEAFYMPASLSLISEYHGPETRSRAMGLHQSSVYAGTVLGGTAAGLCADHYGWRSGFYLFGCAGVVLAGVLLFFRGNGRSSVILIWVSTAEVAHIVAMASRSAWTTFPRGLLATWLDNPRGESVRGDIIRAA
jgi:MFS family permease